MEWTHKSRLWMLCAVAVFLLSACDSEQPAPPPDQTSQTEIDPVTIEADISLVASCSRCHGKDGVSSKPDVPFIAGQSAEYLNLAMRDYLAEERKHDVMRHSVLGLDVAQRQELAMYIPHRHG